MISGPGFPGDVPHNGKENKPDFPLVQPRSAPSTPAKPVASKGFGKTNEKHKTLKIKEKDKEPQSRPEEAVVTEDAFDRLLVSGLSTLFCVGDYVMLHARMIFKFH